MTIATFTQLPSGGDFRSIFSQSTGKAGFLLTAHDKAGIEHLLRNGGTRHAPNPPLLNGLLRHKLRTSCLAPEPAAPELVTSGCLVTYMISGGGARTAELALSHVPVPGRILVASLLGATLLGMRKLQKVPLLREDGQIEAVVVLTVSQPPELGAA
ncbi:hypothetical protein [Salipiger sp.]|uniref:hypothetical protein n=1 Tax=Salipiger sp. TaxID=2078585 RepID=UPI003A98666C